MSRTAEYFSAAVIAAAGISAMIWWPDPSAACPAEIEIETPDPEAPADAEPEDTPEPEVPPEPTPDPEAPVDAEPEVPLEPTPDPDYETLPDLADASGTPFSFMHPGDLIEGSGAGQAARVIYAEGMRFPVETGQAYANSQVWGAGGLHGSAGGQCTVENYSYPWRDNFCETRGYGTPMCPADRGHQGQDIRPPTCQRDVHWAVAAADGVITSIGTYSVRLMSEDGVRYTYLHLDPSMLAVEAGDAVRRGERIGLISDAFGGTPTTIHLHFEIWMAVDAGEAGLLNTTVPPYSSLISAYQRLLNGEDRREGA